MRVLIFGSRAWRNYERIRDDVRDLKGLYSDQLVIIEGEAPRGADAMARRACEELNVDLVPVPAKWHQHDRLKLTPVPCHCSVSRASCRAAGIRRNQVMLDEHRPDRAVGYRSMGNSQGTDDMIRRLSLARIDYRVILEGDQPDMTELWSDPSSGGIISGIEDY